MTTTVAQEWRVVGDPGGLYPHYDFTFSTELYPDPEGAARTFIKTVMSRGEWDRGPDLMSRTVTTTEWKAET